MMNRYNNFPVAALAAAGIALLLTGGCARTGGSDIRAANAPPVNTSAPVPVNAPPGVAASIQASQAQGAAMASKAAANGSAYKQARQQAGN